MAQGNAWSIAFLAELNKPEKIIERYKRSIISLVIALNHGEESKKDELSKTLAIYRELMKEFGQKGSDAYNAALDEGNLTVDASVIVEAFVAAEQICIDEAQIAIESRST